VAEVLKKTQKAKQTKSKEKKFRQRIKQYSHQKRGRKMTISETKKSTKSAHDVPKTKPYKERDDALDDHKCINQDSRRKH
jgi:hypothetical protein